MERKKLNLNSKAWGTGVFVAFLVFSVRVGAVVLNANAHSACGIAGGDTACGGAGTTLTYPLTVNAGSNRALVVFVAFSCDSPMTSDISAVTYAGVTLSKVASQQNTSTDTYMDTWALAAGTQPATGTNNVVVTFNGPGSCMGNYAVHSGAFAANYVNQTTTFTSSNESNGNSGTASVTLASSNASDSVVSLVCSGTAVNSFSSGTPDWFNNVSSSTSCDTDGGGVANGGTTSVSWATSSDQWDVAAVSFQDDGSGHSVPAAAIVQVLSQKSSANSTTLAVAVAATGARHLLVVGVGNHGTRTVTGVSDGTNAFTLATNSRGTNAAIDTEFWYLLSSTVGKTTITITFSGASGTYEKDAVFWEVSGFRRVGFDVANNVSNGTGAANADTGASVTTGENFDFVAGFAFTGDYITANPASGNEFIAGGSETSNGQAGCSVISFTAGSHQPVWTDTTGTNFAASTAAFKESIAHHATQ